MMLSTVITLNLPNQQLWPHPPLSKAITDFSYITLFN
jgi:hypothetical protein